MQNLWAQFTRRQASPLIQFIKYAICGGGAVTVHVIVFFLLAWLIIPALNAEDIFVKLFHISCAPISDAIRARNAMINNALAFLLSNLTAYLLNIAWVFESGRRYPPVDFFLNKLGLIQRATLRACAHRTVEVALFYAVSGIAIAIGTLLMGLMINQWHFTTTVAFGAECVIAALINFALRKFVIFKG